MSPGAFYGRPGAGANPFINPAVGAPVHSGSGFFNDTDATGSSTSANSGMGHISPRDEPIGYFPPVPLTQEMGYFPPMTSAQLANEVLKREESWLGENQKDERMVPSPLEAEPSPSSGTANSGGVERWVVDGNEGSDMGVIKEQELGQDDTDGTSNDIHTQSRAYSLSLSSSPKKPPESVHAQRSDSDPILLQTLGVHAASNTKGQQQINGQPSALGLVV